MPDLILASKRITLRPIAIDDLESIHDLHSLPETDKYNALGIPKNIAETESVIEPWIKENNLKKVNNYTFAIEDKVHKSFLGLLGLHLSEQKYNSGEVWYKIHRDHWNKGFATEALTTILNFGFETLKLHRIVAGCAVDNIASFKVLEKVGMKREGRHREILPLKSGWSDNFEYGILETDKRK